MILIGKVPSGKGDSEGSSIAFVIASMFCVANKENEEIGERDLCLPGLN